VTFKAEMVDAQPVIWKPTSGEEFEGATGWVTEKANLLVSNKGLETALAQCRTSEAELRELVARQAADIDRIYEEKGNCESKILERDE